LADDRALIQQVKEANDIVDVVGSYVSLRPAGPTYKGLCPFHDDHRPSFDVDPRRQRYRCWSCGKYGDVISFVQEHDRVDFREALAMLARRAGITLEKKSESGQNRGRALMLEVVRWAAEQFHRCLLDSPLAEAARKYLGERRLAGETVRRFGLGFAPAGGDWLLTRAVQAGLAVDELEKVGLVARRTEGEGYYDRFRDRVMFPIRDARGQTVGFGGRILPGSPAAQRQPPPPKYYNSADTPLFCKSECLYGLDQARQAAQTEGYLAVVEGYTDVLMAHQMGVSQVVATMGTALNARHVSQLRRFAPRVVLVFDADAGGATGVDRALEIFVSEEVDLAIATLPEGLDPFDLLIQQGPEPFRQALSAAVDALDFKLAQALATESDRGVEGRRRALDSVLRVIALAPERPGHAGAVKRELAVNRIATRLGLREETIWSRLKELKGSVRRPDRPGRQRDDAPREAPAPRRERELLEVLLAEPALVGTALEEIPADELEHPGLRRLLTGLYELYAAGQPADLDQLRPSIDNPRLVEAAIRLQDVGRLHPDRAAWLGRLCREFRKRRLEPEKKEIQDRLHAADDHAEARQLLKQLQDRTGSLD
jgi:DNA primase